MQLLHTALVMRAEIAFALDIWPTGCPTLNVQLGRTASGGRMRFRRFELSGSVTAIPADRLSNTDDGVTVVMERQDTRKCNGCTATNGQGATVAPKSSATPREGEWFSSNKRCVQ
jgi:hypothetical protein